MIPLADFMPVVRTAVPRFHVHAPNTQQVSCIAHDVSTPLMIVAGPGSGKTTVLVLRALRMVFVDGYLPEHIVLTTFTRKAAEELRGRLIEWGLRIKEYLVSRPPQPTPPGFAEWLDSIDINRFVTGTLDSICEELLTTLRDPTDPAPVLVEGFVSNAILATGALFPNQAHSDPQLDAYLGSFNFDGRQPANFGEKIETCRVLLDRFTHDLVDLVAYRAASSHRHARQRLVEYARSYRSVMADGYRMDFALLEESFLQRLEQGRLGRFTDQLKALLVDEYQDTNPLQERIYFTIVERAGASLTIVGDDDQSLYRFRGATVELFRDFQRRFTEQLPGSPRPQLEYLVANYRSTPSIVGHFNTFVLTDASFQAARVQPPKPQIVGQLPENGVPVLGMFREGPAPLADSLADFLWEVFRGNGRAITLPDGSAITIARDPARGDFGDAVLLSRTVNEYARSFRGNPPRERFPRLLRTRLSQLPEPVEVFNPRGRSLRDIPTVQRFLGTILNCIDRGGALQSTLPLRAEAVRYLTQWRGEAAAFAATNPMPEAPHGLAAFVEAWQDQRPQDPDTRWPSEWPVLELGFKLMSWFPMLRDDPEGQVYLEAISRCIAQAATFSSYRSTIIFGRPPHDANSVRAAIRDIFAPMAESSVDVDEEIMPDVPRSRFPMMTIHQAKGLEFPLVIVDVASDYRTNHRSQRFGRFPESPSVVQNMEDDLAPFCEIGPLRQTRDALQRSFDDLVRLHYVGYSRAQSVLMLVGLVPCLQYSTRIRHVGTGWARDGTWSWRTPVSGRPPSLVNDCPLLLI